MTSFSNIPNVDHFAIIQSEMVHIPGDERSRTHPGHGYPAENREIINYQVFRLQQKSEWKAEIIKLTKEGADFKAMYVKVAKIETSVTVKVN